MFSHACWHRRLGELQHSFTSAGRAAGAGPQGGRRGPGRQPPPAPGRRGTQEPRRNAGEEGAGEDGRGGVGQRPEADMERQTAQQRARKERDGDREQSRSWTGRQEGCPAQRGPAMWSGQGWPGGGPGAGGHLSGQPDGVPATSPTYRRRRGRRRPSGSQACSHSGRSRGGCGIPAPRRSGARPPHTRSRLQGEASRAP